MAARQPLIEKMWGVNAMSFFNARRSIALAIPALTVLMVCVTAPTMAQVHQESIYKVAKLKPVDSATKLKVGDPAPDFTLPSVAGKKVSLSDYRGKNNVVISFVPAAWTPVCSRQWPGYNIAEEIFKERGAVVLGVTVDNIPTLYAWTGEMGKLWFPVLSDFWPHGETAAKYGLLRSDGMAERATVIVDKKGIVRSVQVHDINKLPPLDALVEVLDKLGH